jgi:hypothetical protein
MYTSRDKWMKHSRILGHCSRQKPNDLVKQDSIKGNSEELWSSPVHDRNIKEYIMGSHKVASIILLDKDRKTEIYLVVC